MKPTLSAADVADSQFVCLRGIGLKFVQADPRGTIKPLSASATSKQPANRRPHRLPDGTVDLAAVLDNEAAETGLFTT